MLRSRLVLISTLALSLLLISGCKSKEKPSETTAPAAAPQTSASPSSESAPADAAETATADTTAKLAAADWALKQDAIKNDPDGQWAVSATSSSCYGDAKGEDSWAANQTTGAPNVERYADDGKAWAPKDQDAGIEWLELTYPKPVYATEVRVRESFGSGAVIRIELFDQEGKAHLVWGGNDPTTELNYLLVKFPKTDFKTDRVKITLATNAVPGWNEIDAVQLVGKDQ